MESQERYKQAQVRFVCNACGAEATPGSDTCSACGEELVRVAADPMIGTLLPRRYRILSLLGRGAMSVVYKGAYEPLDQLVAVKVLKSHMVSDPYTNKRFSQESRTAGALSHPNIVGILDFGVTEQGVPYIIMEYLKGKSLAEIIAKEERLSVSRALRIFSQAADALAYAHKQGVVHRDIKPSNIIVMDTGEETDVVKIVDFGIAKILTQPGDPMQKLTQTGEVIGTPLYMSPEQCQGKELDGRSDIYSLGCVMYEALTGRPPFLGSSPLETMKQQMTTNPQPVDKVRPDLFLPERLKEVIALSLIKDTRQRYQFMEDVLSELQAIAKRPDLAQSVKAPKDKDAASGLELKIPPVVIKYAIIGAAGLLVLWGATAIFRMITNAPDEAQWKKYSETGRLAFQAGKFKEAEEQHHLALQEAERFKQPDAKRATSLNDLASDHYAQENFEAAERLARQALDMRTQLSAIASANKDADIIAADSLHTLSKVYAATGKIPAAEELAQQALSLRERVLGKDHADVAASLIDLAELSCQTGNLKGATAQLERARKITDTTFGPESAESAAAMNNLALVLEKQDKYPQAEALFKQALGIRQKTLGLDSPLVADSIKNLGSLKYIQHDDAEAESLLLNALEISKKSNGEESAPTADILSCLAIVYEHTKRTEKAEECYRQALQIGEKVFGSNSPRILKYVENMAKFLRSRHDVTGYEVYEEQAKRIKAGSAK